MEVTRCICHDVSFAELKRLSDKEGLGLGELRDRTGCCTGCTMCEPYVRRMLRTGETEMPLMSPAEVDREMAQREGDQG